MRVKTSPAGAACGASALRLVRALPPHCAALFLALRSAYVKDLKKFFKYATSKKDVVRERARLGACVARAWGVGAL